MDVRAHVFIYGDVIGVGFRAWIQRNAKDLGLTGWVRNASVYPEHFGKLSASRSRRVEAVFEGEKEKVEEMLKKSQQGPEVAWVERVDFKWEKATGEFITFDICL